MLSIGAECERSILSPNLCNPPLQVNGYITLTDVANCLVNPSPSAYVPAVECSVYQLLSNAPTSLQWLYSAGAASLAFLLFALVANALGTWLTYLRRISSLHTIPTFMQRLHGENIMVRCELLPCNLALLRRRVAAGAVLRSPHLLRIPPPSVFPFSPLQTTMYAQGVAAFCLMLSFAIWAGQVNSNFMEIESLKAFGMADISTGALIGSPAQSFSGGFAIVIIAWMFTPASAAILLWKQNEVEHVDVGAAAPAQGDPAAVQDAFPQAGAAPALPPGTLPPPTYAPQASGGYSAPGGSVGYAPPVSGML